MSTCPAATNGQHDIEWVTVPARVHNGQAASPEHERGFCWFCDERFTR
jgi:hypothetical protein